MISSGAIVRRNFGGKHATESTYINTLFGKNFFTITDADLILIIDSGFYRIIVVGNNFGYIPEGWLAAHTILVQEAV